MRGFRSIHRWWRNLVTHELLAALRKGVSASAKNALRRDAFGIVGGFLGIVSLFQAWLYAPHLHWMIVPDRVDTVLRPIDPYVTGIDLILGGWNGLGAGVIIFAIGSGIAILWRLGFIAQLAGLLMFLSDFKVAQRASVPSSMWAPELLVGFTYGVLLAMIAFLLVAYGGVTPHWKRTKPAVVPSVSRIAAYSPYGIRRSQSAAGSQRRQ